jgi:hypothetical protein
MNLLLEINSDVAVVVVVVVYSMNQVMYHVEDL